MGAAPRLSVRVLPAEARVAVAAPLRGRRGIVFGAEVGSRRKQGGGVVGSVTSSNGVKRFEITNLFTKGLLPVCVGRSSSDTAYSTIMPEEVGLPTCVGCTCGRDETPVQPQKKSASQVLQKKGTSSASKHYVRHIRKLTSKLHRLLTTSVCSGALCVRQNMARWPVMAYSGRRTHPECWQRLLTTSIMPVALCRLVEP